MNILYIAHESRMGGANLSLLGMIDHFAKEHNIYVVVPIKEGFLVDELHKRGIPVLYQHSFWWMVAPGANSVATFVKKWIYKILVLYNYICAFRLRKVVRQYAIDMIHTNSSVVNTGGILATMTHIPHVWHIREFGQFIDVWRSDRICQFMKDHSERIIAISQAVQEWYKDKLAANQVRVIYNGVGEENLHQKKWEKGQKGIVQFLISGRISEEKGQEEAIEAVALLVERGFHNLHLSIAGPGDAERLHKMTKQKKIEEYVSFLGYRTDLPSIRREMDVELVCSRWEAFGRVTVEAMMSSNPVIGSDIGGTPELIRDGENGYLYRQGDDADLADKMSRFLNNTESIRQMGECAYQASKERFSSKTNAENIMEIYQELIYNKSRVQKKNES